MFGRGENIGTAYIRIVADGTGLDEEIRKEFDKAEPSVRDAGKEHGRTYADEFNKEYRKSYKGHWDKTQKDMVEEQNKALTDSLAKLKLADNFSKSKGWQDMKKRLHDEFGAAGTLAAQNLEQSFRDSTDLEGIARSLGRVGPEIRKAQKQILTDLAKMQTEALKDNENFDKSREAQQSRALKNFFTIQRAHLKAFEAAQVKDRLDADRDLEAHWKKLADDFGMIWDDAHKEDRLRWQQSLKERLDNDRILEEHWAHLAEVDKAHGEALLKVRQDLDREWEISIAEKARAEEEAFARNAAMDKAQRDMENEAYRLNMFHDRARRVQIKQLMADYKDLTALVDRLSKGTEDAFSLKGGGRADLVNRLDLIRRKADALNITTHAMRDGFVDADKALRHTNPTLDKVSGKIDKLAKEIGEGFGGGARNNFFNAIGKLAEGVVKLGKIPFEGISKTINYIRDLRAVAGEGGIGAGVTKVLGDLGKFASMAAGALGGLFGLLGPLISLLSLAAGVVTALASSIGFALVGAVGVLAGALAPGIAAVGALTLAFTGMNTAQKKALSHKMKPLINEFKDLRQAARDGLFGKDFSRVGEIAKEAAPALRVLQPLIRKMARAAGDIGLGFAQAVNSKGFREWRNIMERFLPNAARQLGRITENVFGGIGNLLRGLIPQTGRFLDWVESITQHFQHWSGTLSGQSAIQTFFQHASDSASMFGGFLLSVADLLGTIMSAGRNAGDSLFGSMTAAVDGWNKTLKDNPGILNRWFRDAVKFGKAFGGTIVQLSKVFSILDTEAGRSVATAAFRTLNALLDTLSGLLAPISALLDRGGDGLAKFASGIGAVLIVLPRINKAAGSATNGIANLVSDLRNAGTRMQAVSRLAKVAAGAGGLMLLADAAGRTGGKFKTLETVAGDAMLGFSVAGPWGAAIGAGVGLLGSLFKVSDKVKRAQQGIADSIGNVTDALNQETGATTKAAAAAARKSLADSGVYDAARRMHISLTDVTNAYLGNKDAMHKVGLEMRNDYRKRMKEGGDAMNGFSTDQKILNDSVLAGAGAMDTARRHILQQVAAAKQAKEAAAKAREQTDIWNKALKGMPPDVRVALKNLNWDPTMREIRALGREYDLTPKQVRTLLRADDRASAVAGHLRTLYASLDGKTITTTLRSVTEHVDTRLGVPRTAVGGLFNGAQLRWIGEAGPEAVVPLDRPLSMVDPAVRWLSAIAQGKDAPKMAAGGVGGRPSIDASGWQIVSPNSDPRAVASEVLNQLAAAAY